MRKIIVAARAEKQKAGWRECGIYKQVTHSVGFPTPDGPPSRSIGRFEYESFVVFDFIFPKKAQVFLAKCSFGMMALLVADVLDDAGQLRMTI